MKCQYCHHRAETTVKEVPVCKYHYFNPPKVILGKCFFCENPATNMVNEVLVCKQHLRKPIKPVYKSTTDFIESMVESDRKQGKIWGLD